jgi:hypothetical protein
MKITTDTEAPQLHVNWKQAFLVALHVATLALSLTTHTLWTAEAASRALP